MRLEIGNKYFIETDRKNYILKQKIKTKKGVERESVIGYFSTLKGLAHEMVELEIKGVDKIVRLDSLKKELMDIVDKNTRSISNNLRAYVASLEDKIAQYEGGEMDVD